MRKIKKGFILCPTMGRTMVIPTGDLENQFQATIRMNEPTADIWRWIEAGKTEQEIYTLYAQTYSIDIQQAQQEVDDVIRQMEQAGIFE